MSFEPASPISIVVCDQCQGKGCPGCDNLGVYALKEDQPIGFNLPDFIDLKARRYLKKVFILKRVILIATLALILILIYYAFGN
ncbi:hypothetical protein COW80_04810 [Candidatus Beckwithbacteria bacterium CG22_combo_CG10-13_8_21_14_all_01_47_9]|uniref:Uncharacterized protein n=4 Tax=Candidatus Beckwithiibacteriota TaxID=1752726 RepID=A0A2H0DZL2_9BACT|nr:MAG: hypothetical protein AUJ59_04230 [Candidatus Beckwithbacteria bacterium CG1_02_47_37]PIP87617.1 MAG: hypothetical protein COW80_04810 [Candidatus Beckwithbacteria bacterium CG22_combo_CG10-13_8_21_14_all_01_47_9]PJC66563.1 MAG: hypothetical protein CO018_01300 [Candidatus Beckwithbacteria bacterium CG_4_9_14_0_2_um_filter_47_11]